MRHVASAWWVFVAAVVVACAFSPVRGDDDELPEQDVVDVVNAVAQGDAKKVEAMLKGNAKLVHAKFAGGGPFDGWPLLTIASRDGRRPLVELLLKSGAGVNEKNNSGEVALHYAAANGHKAVVEVLLKHKADVNVRNDADATPLAVAQAGGKKDVVALLKKHGAKE
jgi:ankyrin repeat protein